MFDCGQAIIAPGAKGYGKCLAACEVPALDTPKSGLCGLLPSIMLLPSPVAQPGVNLRCVCLCLRLKHMPHVFCVGHKLFAACVLQCSSFELVFRIMTMSYLMLA